MSPRVPPTHRARVEAHGLAGRYSVPAVEIDLPAVSVDHARGLAVTEAHRRAGVPPWKPWRWIGLRHATAEPLPESELPSLRGKAGT
jgi:hypothetical protein